MRLSSLPSLARLVALVFGMALLFIVFAPGCGRSSLELETLDSGPSTNNCGPSNCPGGCCDTTGACRVGADARACGAGGGACSDCVANGFEFCAANKVCGRNVTDCVNDCPNGCCSSDTGTTTCLAGTDDNACGIGGTMCNNCSAQGRACDPVARNCGAGQCNVANCPGCCVGDKCLPGSDDQSCGQNGMTCTSCAAMGQTCTPAGPPGAGMCTGMPTCGPANCAGCCEGTVCVTGTDTNACGKQGAACNNCAVTGKTCVAPGQPNERTCQTPVTCNAANCPGCCVGNACVVATTPAECGKGGNACAACGANEACTNGVCVPAPNCSAANCAGCCIGADICAIGSQNTACGVAGAQCQNCTGQGRVCQGGSCQVQACGPANCAGCCSGNTCVLGTQDNACGAAGAACNDCTGGNQVCQGRVCKDKCSAANCAGCCTATNTCDLGFTNTACGSGGATCTNCSAAGSTCDTLVAPRVCTNAQSKCPAPYGACPAGTTTPVTASLQGLCDDVADLDALQAACAGGPDTGSCVAAFAVLAGQNPACSACLTPFDQPFAQLRGVYLCAAPFASASCNHSTGCASDCQDTSCNQCPAASDTQCRNQVNGNGGQCNAFVQQTACVAGALGPGALCNPATYGAPATSFGRWLRAVGDHFCGNGP